MSVIDEYFSSVDFLEELARQSYGDNFDEVSRIFDRDEELRSDFYGFPRFW